MGGGAGETGLLSHGLFPSVSNVTVLANIVTTGFNIGGFIGKGYGQFSHIKFNGNLVANGSGVGGVIGLSERETSVLHADISGNLIGGLSKKELGCPPSQQNHVLGQFGSVRCDGDLNYTNSGDSYVAGIVGAAEKNIFIENSRVQGSVRGVNVIGGLIGETSSEQVWPYLKDNQVNSVVSGTDPNGHFGSLIAKIDYDFCTQDYSQAISLLNQSSSGNTWNGNETSQSHSLGVWYGGPSKTEAVFIEKIFGR